MFYKMNETTKSIHSTLLNKDGKFEWEWKLSTHADYQGHNVLVSLKHQPWAERTYMIILRITVSFLVQV